MSIPTGSTGDDAFAVHDELTALPLRMVAEYPEHPAGSVIRCVARAVRRVLIMGTPLDQLPARAEHAARHALALRGSRVPRHAGDRPSTQNLGPRQRSSRVERARGQR